MTTPLPPRQFTMVPGQDIDPLFLCPICQDSWADPVELVPCGDIFCQSCISASRTQHTAQPMIMENFQCPQCHTVVQNEKRPNRMLLNTVLAVEVECYYCQWRGTREASAQHECEEGKKPKACEAATSPLPNTSARTNNINKSPSSPLLVGNSSTTFAQRTGAELELSSSTVPSPSKARALRCASGNSPLPPEPISSPTGLRRPRRAVQEIEGAFTAIEDDPTSSTLRACTKDVTGGVSSTSAAAAAVTSSLTTSCDYVFGNLRNSGTCGGGGGNTSGADGVCGKHPDQVLTCPLHPSIGRLTSPQSSPVDVPHTPASSPSLSSSTTNSNERWRRYRLSQVEYDQLVGIFMMYDEGTGRLNHQQLRDLCFCMNFVQREDHVAVIFGSMDSARKGYVTQDDFLLWLSTHRPDPSALFGLTQFEYTDGILQFRSVDPEFNGVIDANDFCTLCLTNGYTQTSDEAMRYFHLCDDRHTGYVSLQKYLSNLKMLKNKNNTCGGGGNSGGDGPDMRPCALSQQQQPSMGRVLGNNGGSSTEGPFSLSANTPRRTTGSNDSGHNGVGANSFGFPVPQLSDYSRTDPPKTLEQPSQAYRQPYSGQQSGALNLCPPTGAAKAMSQQQQLQHFQHFQEQIPPHQQRLMTSLDSFPGDVQHQQQLQLQRQQAVQQQPYSQMGRSTTPASPQVPSRSRLHRPSARPQRGEECVMM